MMNFAQRFLKSIAAGLVLVVVSWPALADGERVNKDADDLAIKGYDPVAYFTEGRPVQGKAEFEHVWRDARWRFARAEHQEMFASDPQKYAPRYGGFCSGAMALGRLAPIDPEAWVIVDGRLYLNYSKSGRDRFAEDPEPAIGKADPNWEQLGRTN